MKVTWKSSGRIHRTAEGRYTFCGHFIGNYIPMKNKCKTCFTKKEHHREPWITE